MPSEFDNKPRTVGPRRDDESRDDYIARVIDSAPPLTSEQAERIRGLLPPVPMPSDFSDQG
jgi:hypothetical protein